MNRTRTFLLMVGLTVLFVVVGGAIGGRQGAIWAFIIAAGMNFYSYWFSDKLVLKHYQAREVGPNDGGRLYATVAERKRPPMPSQRAEIRTMRQSRPRREFSRFSMTMSFPV